MEVTGVFVTLHAGTRLGRLRGAQSSGEARYRRIFTEAPADRLGGARQDAPKWGRSTARWRRPRCAGLAAHIRAGVLLKANSSVDTSPATAMRNGMNRETQSRTSLASRHDFSTWTKLFAVVVNVQVWGVRALYRVGEGRLS